MNVDTMKDLIVPNTQYFPSSKPHTASGSVDKSNTCSISNPFHLLRLQRIAGTNLQ